MYTIPPQLKQEINEYKRLIDDYRSGRVEPVKFKSIRVPMGIYEQRENDTYMVRIRCTGGFITPFQLRQTARIAREHNAGYIHITTRQELQLQDVALENTGKILEQLHENGLSSRGGGGNTVRNIMASVDSGISADEPFDVLPYAVALTDKLTAEPDSWLLPRKFKISFSSSDRDNAYAAFNDLGFIAKIKDGERGFKVYLGGSLGVKPMTGHVLFEFLPAYYLFYVAEAAKKLFSRYGNRRNRHRARLRFVFYKYGKEKVIEYFHAIYSQVKTASGQDLLLRDPVPGPAPAKPVPVLGEGPDYELWKTRYVKQQRDPALYSILIPVSKGNLDADRCEALAMLLENFGEDTIRFTMRQNIRLRNIPAPYLGNIHMFLKETGFATQKANILNSMVACNGADTCRLGICQSKSAMEKILAGLENSGLDLDGLKDLNINISGCPNSCGQQSAADLGFYGKVGRTDRIYPAYAIVAGARSGDGISRLARHVDEISARDLPRFLKEFLEIYLSRKSKYDTFSGYIDSEGENDIRRICDKFRDIPGFDEDKNYYYDWGADNIFSLSGRGDGQCSAGLFDMIDFDLQNIKRYIDEFNTIDHSLPAGKAREEINVANSYAGSGFAFYGRKFFQNAGSVNPMQANGDIGRWSNNDHTSGKNRDSGESESNDNLNSPEGSHDRSLANENGKNGYRQKELPGSRENELLYQIIFSASRMLLITRGFEPKATREVFDGFSDKFIGAGLADEKFRRVVTMARDDKAADFTKFRDSIFELAGVVIQLYENMDDSLQFNIPEKENNENSHSRPAMKKDYRSVACPMNFVKTKIDLAAMKKGELLEILIDDGEPVENVPGSVRSEGHRIISQTKTDNYWSVLIEKG